MRRWTLLPKATLERLAYLLGKSDLPTAEKAIVVQFLHYACLEGEMNPAFNLATFLDQAGMTQTLKTWGKIDDQSER